MIDIPTIENLCANICFVLLFLTTLFYWTKTIFIEETGYNQTGLVGYGTAIFCLTTLLVLRWVNSGHFPLSNLYESLVFLAWCLLILHIYLETSMKTLFLGVLTSPAILCLIAFTDFSLPAELRRSTALVPALQSNWLIMHVTVMIASYAALLLGCLIAIAYLIFSKTLPQTFFAKNLNFGAGPSSFLETSESFVQRTENFDRSSLMTKQKNPDKILKFLDNLSYRTIGIGFCFLTLGILSGAVWANETWGNYWSWDPKETWAFITWLTFATYLHSRLIGGWTGAKPAWIASFGFLIIWVCYLGVNLLGQGLHSYGFLQL